MGGEKVREKEEKRKTLALILRIKPENESCQQGKKGNVGTNSRKKQYKRNTR